MTARHQVRGGTSAAVIEGELAGKVDKTGFSGERVFAAYFAGAANEKRDIYFTGKAATTIEVTLVGWVAGANTSGTVRAIFSVHGSQTGTVYVSSMDYTAAQGYTPEYFGLKPAVWDATNNRWKITIVHRAAFEDMISVGVRWQGQGAEHDTNMRNSLGLGATYTTDSTKVPLPVVDNGLPVIRPEQFGAFGDGVADDTAAVVTAFAKARNMRRVGLGGNIFKSGATVALSGVYNLATLAGPIEVSSDVQGSTATLLVPTNYAQAVLLVGHATSGLELHDATISLPDVQKVTTGTLTAGSIGVQVQNVTHSMLRFGRTTCFEVGLFFTGLNAGNVYNQVFIGWVDLCKVSMVLTPGVGGWVNQNTFIAGGTQQSPNAYGGTAIRRAGWRHIVLDGLDRDTVHANTFVGVSCEGDYSEYTMTFQNATHNVFIGTRFEQGTAPVAVTVSGATITANAHGLVVGEMVAFLSSGAAPGGMVGARPYYVHSVTTNTFTVKAAATDATAITFTSAGSGVLLYRPVRMVFDGPNAHHNSIRNSNTWPGPISLIQVNGAYGNVIGDDTALEAEVVGKVAKGELVVNVRDYGARGDGVTNDSAAFAAAITAAGSTRSVYVPAGTYIVAPGTIALGAAARLVGEYYGSTTIQSNASKTGIGVAITGVGAEVSNLFIRGYKVGIDNRKWFTKIYENKLSYNEIGIDYSIDSYITKARGNEITFNDVGIVIRTAAQPYELVISENVIDNNNGVGIATYSGSGGLVIENNTIEGNRNYTSDVGCGILVRGTNLSRLKIDGNWFEANGNHATSAVDIFMLCPSGEPATMAALRTAIVAVLPADLQASFATGGCAVGSVSITRNAFIFTKYGAVVAGFKASITVAGNTFKGILGRNNKHIFLNVPSGISGMGGSRVSIEGNNYRNSDDVTIDAQVATGIAGTIVHSDSVMSGVGDVFLHDGMLLFGAFTGEKVYPVAFAAAANEKVDLYFTGTVWSAIEITLVGLYQNANASGVVRVVYSLAGSSTGTVYDSSSTVLVAQGALPDHFGLTAATWDATNSRWKITIAHRNAIANAVSMQVKWQTQSPTHAAAIRDSIGVSAVYTTDATVVAAPVVKAVQRGDLVLNVKDFGALGNGTGNDATAIQAAIDSLPTSGTYTGGKIYFPIGTYRLTTPIVLKSGIHLVGASRSGSRISAAAGGLFIWTNHLSNVTIEHLNLGGASGHLFTNSGGDWGWHTSVVADCNIVQQDNTKSIVHHVSASDYDNVTFRDCNLVVAAGATVPAFNIINSAGAANENRWSDCWAHANNSSAAPFFYIESTSDQNYAYDNVFENITGEQNGGGLIDARSSYNLIVRNCTDYDTTVTYTSDVIRVGKSSATGGLPSVGALIEGSGRRDNTTLPANIYDINLVPNGARRCTVINPNHSSSNLKMNWSDADGHRILGMNAGKGPAAQPADATDFLQTTKVQALYIGNTTTGAAKKTVGTGSPEGAVSGSVGDEYTRMDGTGGDVLYIKRSGAATTTGWVSTGRSLPPAYTPSGGRRLLSGWPYPSAIGTFALAKDTWRYSPLSLAKDLTVTHLSVLCSVAPTGGTALMVFGLWALDASGKPATRQADWSTYGSIDLTVGAGGESIVATGGLVIPAGEWAIGCAWTGTATTNPTMFATTGAHPGVAANSIAVQANAYTQAVSGATPPSPAVPAATSAQGVAIYGVMP